MVIDDVDALRLLIALLHAVLEGLDVAAREVAAVVVDAAADLVLVPGGRGIDGVVVLVVDARQRRGADELRAPDPARVLRLVAEAVLHVAAAVDVGDGQAARGVRAGRDAVVEGVGGGRGQVAAVVVLEAEDLELGARGGGEDGVVVNRVLAGEFGLDAVEQEEGQGGEAQELELGHCRYGGVASVE